MLLYLNHLEMREPVDNMDKTWYVSGFKEAYQWNVDTGERVKEIVQSPNGQWYVRYSPIYDSRDKLFVRVYMDMGTDDYSTMEISELDRFNIGRSNVRVTNDNKVRRVYDSLEPLQAEVKQ